MLTNSGNQGSSISCAKLTRTLRRRIWLASFEGRSPRFTAVRESWGCTRAQNIWRVRTPADCAEATTSVGERASNAGMCRRTRAFAVRAGLPAEWPKPNSSQGQSPTLGGPWGPPAAPKRDTSSARSRTPVTRPATGSANTSSCGRKHTGPSPRDTRSPSRMGTKTISTWKTWS